MLYEMDIPPKHYRNGDRNIFPPCFVSYLMPHSLIHAASVRSDRPKIVNLQTNLQTYVVRSR